MQESTAMIVESDGGDAYPFAELSRLRNDAGNFMTRALEEDDEMEEDEPHHVITPDNPWFNATHASMPPQVASQPQQPALQPAIPMMLPPSVQEHNGELTDARELVCLVEGVNQGVPSALSHTFQSNMSKLKYG